MPDERIVFETARLTLRRMVMEDLVFSIARTEP